MNDQQISLGCRSSFDRGLCSIDCERDMFDRRGPCTNLETIRAGIDVLERSGPEANVEPIAQGREVHVEYQELIRRIGIVIRRETVEHRSTLFNHPAVDGQIEDRVHFDAIEFVRTRRDGHEGRTFDRKCPVLK